MRCTARLQRDLPQGMGEGENAELTTTKLGDWFANRFNFGAQRYVMCTSEHSLLTLLVPARDLGKLPERLVAALHEMMADLVVPRSACEAEFKAMERFQIARTNNRSILGTMNDMAVQAEAEFYAGHLGGDLRGINRRLADVPCGPLGYDRPGERAWRLLRS